MKQSGVVTAKPFLKWAGGKTALLHEILPRLPKKINTYYEPFVGGGAVFFALAAEKRFEKAVLSDVNEELIATYNALGFFVNEVIHELKSHAERHCEEHYYRVRAQSPRTVDRKAARFIYLNRVCFNGLYRVNKKGGFNVPFGDYKNPTICDEKNLIAVSSVLCAFKNRETIVTAYKSDFARAAHRAGPDDAVYIDPPYAPVSETANFTAYTKGGFDESDQIRLRDWFAELDKRGVHVLLSNSDTPLIRKLYKGFRIEEVEAPRRVNSKASKRGNVKELLISGKNT